MSKKNIIHSSGSTSQQYPSILYQLYKYSMDNIVNKLKDIDKMDINDLIGLNAELKENCMTNGKTNDYKKQVAEVWFASGEQILFKGDLDAAELCFFMAHNYDQTNFVIMRNLILVYANNRKFRAAIDHLDTLYNISNEGQITIFWEILTEILPQKELKVIINKSKLDPLSRITEEFKLDEENPMTWLCLGYTLKLIDEFILSNQAIDNALALRILQN